MPSLTDLEGDASFAENQVNAAPQIIDADITIADPEGDFNGGKLIVTGLLAEDRLSILHEGNGAGEVGVSGATIRYGGVIVGTVSGGVGNTFIVTFNANATTEAVEAVAERVAYANVSDGPTRFRDLTFNVEDAAGNDLLVPSFGSPTVLDLVGSTFYTSPALMDLDGDGDLDVVLGTSTGAILGVRNVGGVLDYFFPGNQLPFTQLSGFTAPTLFDIDRDGDLDIVVGSNGGALVALRNTGTSFVQMVGFDDPFRGMSMPPGARPTFIDVTGDGLKDLVIGSQIGAIYVWRNDGFSFTPLTGSDNPFAGISGVTNSHPAAADVDGDGDDDLVVGFSNGTLRLYENRGGNVFVLATGVNNPFPSGVVGSNATPTFGDWNGDGLPDIVLGSFDQDLRLILNTATDRPVVRVEVIAEADAPTLRANLGMTINEGAEGIIGYWNLEFDDYDQPDTEITYTITSLTNGTVLRNGAPLGLGGTFTQDDLVNYRVRFRHDGSETTSGSFGFSVTDGVDGTITGQTFLVTVNPLNDAPVLIANHGARLEDGASVTITSAMLDYDDAEQANTAIVYTLETAVVNGTLSKDGVPLAAGDSFTEADIVAGRIAYLHDGSATTSDSFDFSLSDGAGGDFTGLTFDIIIGTPALDDPATVAENATVAIDVLANDVDGAVVAEVDGQALTVGVAITLASGATVTLNADGTLTYDPNGQFGSLVPQALSTGAVNTAVTDGFSYTLASGDTANVIVTVTGVQSAGDQLWGDSGANTITGTSGADTFILDDGGDDTVDGGDGIDGFFMGGALTPDDVIDGGASNDLLGLQGNYAGYTFSASNMVGIEMLVLLSGSVTTYSGGPGTARYDYDLTTIDANVAAGQTMVIHATTLLAGESLRFDGSAETDGSFFFYGGAGDDTLIGGALADIFASGLGQDTLTGGGGNDVFYYRLTAESPDSAHDSITDFTAGDLIHLWALGEPGGLGVSFIGDDDFSNVAGQLRVTGSGTSWTVEMDVDGDGDADFIIDVTTTASDYQWGKGDFVM